MPVWTVTARLIARDPPRDSSLEIHERFDHARQLLDRVREVVVAAGTEDIVERDRDSLGVRLRRGESRGAIGSAPAVHGWARVPRR